MSRLIAVPARCGVAVLALMLLLPAPSAHTQVQATFFAPFGPPPYPPIPAPNPNLPFPGTAVCTTNVGGPSGFSLNFVSAPTQSFLQSACGSSVAAMLVHSFAVRFVGSLVAPSAGVFNLAFNADDGDVLTINGTTIASDWFDKGGGPGSINATLNAGANPFVFDYYENHFGGAFATLQLPPNLPVQPPTPQPPPNVTPEPTTVALFGSGLLLVLGVGYRRRSARA